MEESKPRKKYVLKAAAAAAAEKPAKRQYTLKKALAEEPVSAAAKEPKKKAFSLRRKKPVELMTYAEEIEDAVRTYYMSMGHENIPEEEKEFMREMLAHDAEAAEKGVIPPGFYDDAAPVREMTEAEAAEERQRLIDEAGPPPQGTPEFWAWIRRRKARINKERAEKGLPPLPTKKEKEAAAAKKKAEKESAKAAKVAEKAAKAAAKAAKAEAKKAK